MGILQSFQNAILKTEDMKFVNETIRENATTQLTDVEFLEREIDAFRVSEKRRLMIQGEQYYRGDHDIKKRQRTVIGEDRGTLEVVDNLPNNRIVDNQYKKMVRQKSNYLVGNPVVFQTDSKDLDKLLKGTFDNAFDRTLKNLAKDSLNFGIAWLYVYYSDKGLAFKKIKSYQLIPGWSDEEHTELDYAIYFYNVTAFDGKKETEITKVEVFDKSGIYYYTDYGDGLVPDTEYYKPYLIINGDPFNWDNIPLIPFKYTQEEIPLIKDIKNLQDGLNLITSNFQNQMEEDVRNTILVLVNYDGQNLGEFRKNLATYGAVKVKTTDGAPGDVRTLQVEVNSENYRAIIQIFKKAIIENAMGFDAKDDRLTGQPNQMNIMSMYSDIDLDANEMETEYKASFEELLRFVLNTYYNERKGKYTDEAVEIVFKRNMMMNTNDTIAGLQQSVGIISNETIVANHPYVDDVKAELEKIAKEKEDDSYQNAFLGGDDDGEEE